MTEKQFDSIFVPRLQVDAANYITELVISNKLEYWAKVKKRVPEIPKCAFWRKSYVNQNPKYKVLAKDYQLELLFVKKLLFCFSPKTILQYVKDKKIITFVYLQLNKQQVLIYNLWRTECTNRSTTRKKKRVTTTKEVTKTKTMPTDLTGLL